MSVMQAGARRKAAQPEGHERIGTEQLSCMLAWMLVPTAHGLQLVLSLLLTCTERNVAQCDDRC